MVLPSCACKSVFFSYHTSPKKTTYHTRPDNVVDLHKVDETDGKDGEVCLCVQARLRAIAGLIVAKVGDLGLWDLLVAVGGASAGLGGLAGFAWGSGGRHLACAMQSLQVGVEKKERKEWREMVRRMRQQGEVENGGS